MKAAVRSLTKKLVRKRIIDDGIRIDGRTTTEIRPLSAEVDLLPTAHGSALFQRGETQVLNVTTLGMPRMNQLLDTISPDDSKRYMHHYNFPPYLDRGGRPDARATAPGNRPRAAGRAGPAPGGPEPGGVPLHPAPRLRRPRIQRLDVDGVGVRVDPVAHGGRGADPRAGGRNRDGSRRRGRRLRDPDRHPRVPRTPSATWTSRSPAPPMR